MTLIPRSIGFSCRQLVSEMEFSNGKRVPWFFGYEQVRPSKCPAAAKEGEMIV